jgi:hypothetical protein
MIRAEGRFSLALQKAQEPESILEDFTVFG